jgi:uroporphyrinogen-III synthase
LTVLWNALEDDERRALCCRPAVASSERLCVHLRKLGFTRVVRAENAHPTALLDALAAHVSHGRFR